MKRLLSLMVLMLGIGAISLSQAQNPTVLRFTGQGSNGAYLQLSSVEVKNLTRGWEETLVYPDTILIMGNVGIDDYASISRFALSQNTPNPFKGSTDFSLQMPEANRVTIAIHDINGKKITDLTQDLPVGIHIFRVILNTPQTYLVTAKTEQHTATIKIINQGNESLNRIEYRGMGPGHITYEMGGDKSTFSDHDFQLGDLMCYVGKYVFNDVEYSSDTILQPQYESQDFHLVFHCVPLINSVFSATTCDAFTWNGQTYTQSGTYTQTFLAANGCDSIVTLNLTVGQPMTSTSSATACGSYVWNGQTYTQSGTYTQTFQTANGCDSVVTLNLTVNQSSLPVLSEVQVYGINAHTANVMASALSDSCSPVLSQGFCWNTQPNPVVSGLHTDCPVEMTTFFSGLSGLEANQTYYVRAYATNAVGIAYSSSATFTTDSYLSFTLLVDTPCTSASAVSPPSADVLDYCAGMDSVRLSIGNYQYGNIQWQYSEDMFTWTDILGANDTVYLFQPSDECFIRARMQYPNCPPDSSQVSHIRLSPTANAGPDRVLNEGYVTHLFGNKVDNAYCVWQVIQGDSAELDDPTDRNSAFSGPDTLYRLTWTVDNACGVSTDTVEIRYVHTVMYDAIAIVDTTDLILSDSAELAAGIYRIVFSNPVPNITDSTVLVGMVDDGFLRKVLYFEYYGDTCKMVTSQGYITDILKEGAINLEVPMSLAVSSQRGGSYHSFTRAELLQDPRYLSGNWGALFNDVTHSNQRDLSENQWNIGPVTLGGHYDLYDVTPDLSDIRMIEDWYVHPYVLAGNGYVSYKVGLIGDLIFDFTFGATHLAGSIDISKDIPNILGGGIPGLAKASLDLSCNLTVTLGGNLSDSFQRHYRYTKPIHYVAEGKAIVVNFVPIPVYYDVDTTKAGKGVVEEIDPSQTNASLDVSLGIGPKLNGKLLFGVAQLYFVFMPQIAFNFCNGANGFESESTELRLYEELGLKIGIGDLLSWEPNLNWDQILRSWKRPYKISTNTNRNLVQPSANSYIQDPIYVHVFKQNNEPRGGNKVLFEATGGVVSSTPSGSGSASAFATTNTSGIAQIYWKPLSSNATLKASVLDCEGYHIKGSPLYFYSNGVGDLCLNSNLSLAIGNDGHFITSGGTSPFLYSSNGISWLPEFNMSYPLTAGTYFVKDVNGCIASTTYTVQEATSPCNLTTNTYQNGLQVRFVANNGTSPYHFFVDGVDLTAPNGTTNRVLQQTFTQAGEHTFTVTDANGCTKSSIVHVTDGITLPSVVTIASYNTSNQVYDAVMGAVTDNGGATILERGIQWSLSSDMSNATSVVSNQTSAQYICHISGVSPGTTYYARAYAINTKGPGYGEIITIIVPGGTPSGDGQPCPGTPTVTDYDGNVYNTVQIGQQCWMKENLRTTHYADGTGIPSGGSDTSSTEPYYYDYSSSVIPLVERGLLYNWSAVMNGGSNSTSVPSGVQGVCPTGWHVPSDMEWVTMEQTQTSMDVSGEGWRGNHAGRLAGGNHWYSSSNDYAPGNMSYSDRNVSGFSIVPAGFCSGYHFHNAGSITLFWTSTEESCGYDAYTRTLNKNYASVCRDHNLKYFGCSVRCVFGEGSNTVSLPTVITNTVSNIMSTSATCGGNVTDDGGLTVTSRGICWAMSNTHPTIANSHTNDGGGAGEFTSTIVDLNPNCGYYVRAYATNSYGTNYGCVVYFTTSASTPTEFTCGISTVTDHEGNEYHTVKIGNQCWTKENMRCVTSPSTGTNIVNTPAEMYTYTGKMAKWYNNDQSAALANGYGLLYNWNATVDTFDVSYGETSVDTNSAHAFSVTFSGHRRGICPEGWHVPTDAEWTALTNYLSSQNDYSCGGNDDHIAKAMASQVGWDTSYLNCTVGCSQTMNNSSGFNALPAGIYSYELNEIGEVSLYFSEPGEMSLFWSATQSENESAWYRYLEYYDLVVNREAEFSSKVMGGSVRCVYDEETFSSATLPTVTTSTVTVLSNTSAECGGEVVSDGGATVTVRGVCWSTSQNPTVLDNHTTDGSGVGGFVSSIAGLSDVSTYYVRAYATNGVGTVYGNEVSFITVPYPEMQPCPNAPTVTDYDGNVYNTVKIGNQCWMKENLRTTHYGNGSAILESSFTPTTPGPGVFEPITMPLFYHTDGGNDSECGLLYNWMAAMGGANSSENTPSGVQGVCPNGWHVPSDGEWDLLIAYAKNHSQYWCGNDSLNVAKSLAGASGWVSSPNNCAVGNNPSANNALGFSALPVGYAVLENYTYGNYVGFGTSAAFWSTTELYYDSYFGGFLNAGGCQFDYSASNISRFGHDKGSGLSVRCLRDEDGNGTTEPGVTDDGDGHCGGGDDGL